jgi:hypothetical protein
MTDIPTAPEAPSHGAERMRRHRERRMRGGVFIEFEVVGSALDALVALGWLRADSRHDADAVRAAIIWLAGRALDLELRRG